MLLVYDAKSAPPLHFRPARSATIHDNDMQTSVIRHRVADFLKRFPPFDSLPESDVLDLAGHGKVKFHESDEYIFRQGDGKMQMVWLIQQGRVELLEDSGAGEQLRDVLAEGDLLGLDCFVGERCCLNSARTASDVILYGIRTTQFESLITRHAAVKRFLSAHFSVAADVGIGRTSWLDAEPPPAEFLRARLKTLPFDAPPEESAVGVIAAKNGVTGLVDDNGRPAAIIRAMDLCAPPSGLSGQRSQLSSPTITAAALTTRSAVREMLQSRSGTIAITADGTAESRLEAVLTASELALFCGYDPLGLVRAIRRGDSAAEFVPLLGRAMQMVLDGLAVPQDVDDCCRIKTEVVGALTEACFRLAREGVLALGLDPPVVPCCWLSVGSFARGDQLEHELPAIAVVYDDAAEGFRPEDSIYFTALTGEAMAWFHGCGLTDLGWFWPEGSQQCMPLSEWTRLYCETIRNPIANNLYGRRELLDLRILFGD